MSGSGVVRGGDRGKISGPLMGCVLSVCRIFAHVALKCLLSYVVNVCPMGEYAALIGSRKR